MSQPTMDQLDGLVFPALLPGHTWLVEKGNDSFVDSWDSWKIYIINKRKWWFDQVITEKRVYLDEAYKRLKNAGFGKDDTEAIPTDEVGRWRMYVMKAAEQMHDEYVERHKVPIKYQAMHNFMSTIESELNVDNSWEQEA